MCFRLFAPSSILALQTRGHLNVGLEQARAVFIALRLRRSGPWTFIAAAADTLDGRCEGAKRAPLE